LRKMWSVYCHAKQR